MEGARDLALEMQAKGQGIVLDQFATQITQSPITVPQALN